MDLNDVSIIIPVYCTSPESLGWLDECLVSAMSQGCEVVVYDDGSTMTIRNLVKHHRVPIFSLDNPNRGVSFARNQAIRLASKSLILPLDCDDRLVEGAVSKMLEVWAGVPVYPDIAKFGDEVDPHYALLDFNCDHVYNYVGFTSVNVLHLKSQWASIGGYDESVDFYEDGEYNARLLATYCGQRIPIPLVEYRQHKSQRTSVTDAGVARQKAVKLLEQIRRFPAMCKSCGGSRRSQSNLAAASAKAATTTVASAPVQVQGVSQPVDMPLELNGNILARYLGGKGAAQHFYKGIRSKFPYRVTYGDFVYAKPMDVCEPGQTWSFLVRYIPPSPQEAPKPAPVVAAPALVQPQEALVEPAPMTVEAVVDMAAQPEVELPNIIDLNVKEILGMTFDHDVALKLIEIEAAGLNRRKVLEWLKAQ